MSDKLTFEKAMERLEEIVSILENGKCSLDESLKLFEEGTKLSKLCKTELDSAEQKIVELQANGETKEMEFDSLEGANE